MTLDQLRSMAGIFDGVSIHVSAHLLCKKEWKQVRFPKTRRKRIRKKWAKNKRRNWASVDAEPVFMHVNGMIYTNELGYQQIKRGFAQG